MVAIVLELLNEAISLFDNPREKYRLASEIEHNVDDFQWYHELSEGEDIAFLVYLPVVDKDLGAEAIEFGQMVDSIIEVHDIVTDYPELEFECRIYDD